MVYGFKIIDDLTDGLANYLDAKAFASVRELVGKAVPSVTDWQYLNLNHIEKAWIDQDLCIKCGRCHIACEDTAHQAITATVNGERRFEVIDAECVGCNLCVSVCPVENCITMRPMTSGIDPRTNRPIRHEKADWTTHPNNPARRRA
jgi:dihydropyrimidine dehydrogenase (NAD+) subunit PreA